MTDYEREKKLQRKREYYREWRARNRESVLTSQAKYYAKKAAELQSRDHPAEDRLQAD